MDLSDENAVARGYLDTATIGLVPGEAVKAARECWDALRSGIRGEFVWRPLIDRARALIAFEIGLEFDDVAFTSSASEALNAIASAVALAERDEALVMDDEYRSVIFAWASGPGTLVRVPVGLLDRASALQAAIGPRTRVVCVSHVHPITGEVVDLVRLSAACRKRQVMLIVDGSQALGLLPVDGRVSDVYLATGHKWLRSGPGAAVVACNPKSALAEALAAVDRRVAGPHPTLAHENWPAIAAIGGAAQVRARHRGEMENAVRLADRIHADASSLGLNVYVRTTPSSGIVTLGGWDDVRGAEQQMRERGIRVARRQGMLRVSPGPYNNDSDVDLLLDALGAESARRQSGSRGASKGQADEPQVP